MEIKDEGFFIIKTYPKRNAVTLSVITWDMEENAYFIKSYCRIGVDYVSEIASVGPFKTFEQAKDDLNNSNKDWYEGILEHSSSSGVMDQRKKVESMTKYDWADHKENLRRREEAEKLAKKKAKKHGYYLQRKERIAKGEPTNPRMVNMSPEDYWKAKEKEDELERWLKQGDS